MLIIAIKDVKSGAFGTITCVPNKDVALRQADTLANDPSKTIVSLYPGDFELYALGTFNEKNGSIESKVDFLVNLKDLVHKE